MRLLALLALLITGALLGLGPSATAVAAQAPAAGVAPVNSCWPRDTNAPRLGEVTAVPAVADTTDGPATVQIRVRATDPGGPGPASGLAGGNVTVDSDDQVRPYLREVVSLEPSGDHMLRGTLTLPRYSGAGRYELRELDVLDRAGNRTPNAYTGWPGDEPAGSFEVVMTAEDDSPPVLESFDISDATVDTTAAEQEITFTAQVSEVGTGVDRVQVVLDPPAPGEFGDLRPQMTRTSGSDEGESTWTGSFRVQRFVGSGTWDVSVAVSDRLGNGSSSTSAFGVVSGPIDRTAPDTTTVTRSPRTIDVREHSDQVVVSVHGADAGSGVDHGRVFLDPQYRADSGAPSAPLELVSGSSTEGVWRATLTAPRCGTAAGVLPIELDLTDARGNTRVVDRAATVTVRASDTLRPFGDIGRAKHLAPRGPLTITTDERVQDISSRTVGLLRPNPATHDFTRIAGTWRCFTATKPGSGSRTSCSGDRIRRAEFTPRLRFPRVFRCDFTAPGQPSATDRAGNPLSGGESSCRSPG